MAKEKQFSTKILHEITKKLYLNEDTADVFFTFEVDDYVRRVPAHKNILASGSPVFKAMFYSDLKEKSDVKLVDATPSGFIHFLALFYSNEMNITSQHVAEIAYLTNKYDVSEGLEICEEFMLEHTTVSELCDHLFLAIKFNLNQLRTYCETEIRAKPNEIFKSDSFLNITLNMLKLVLQLGDHKCNEVDILNACIAWAANICKQKNTDPNDKQNIRRELGECFYLIPFTKMKLETFIVVASANRALFTLNDVIDIQSIIMC